MSDWRKYAEKVISEVLAEAKKDGIIDTSEIKKRISAAYPFGERQYHPYKIWLDCVRKATGTPSAKARKAQARIDATYAKSLLDGEQ